MKEITKEMLAKARECKSVEELKALAVENKIEVSNEELEKTFSKYCNSGEVADEELDNVSGGCGSDEPQVYHSLCPYCGCTYARSYREFWAKDLSYICVECGKAHSL